MSIRALLTVLDHRGSNHRLLEMSCALAATWRARLEVSLPYPPLGEADQRAISDLPMGQDLQRAVDAARQREAEQVKAYRREFEDCCRMHAIAIIAGDVGLQPFARWIVCTEVNRVCRVVWHARLADLVLVQRPHAETGDDYENLIDQVLADAGRPVLLVPPHVVEPTCARIAIAWNGSAENARAVAAALDLIEAADAVDVITAEDDHTRAVTAEKLVSYLASHDIFATKHVVAEGDNRPTGQAILDACHDLDSDLLVMGAYTHARWQERMFGGVTCHMMSHAELPVLMAH